MSTRSLTIFMDEYDQEIAVMYRHYDGYPHGHGAELKEILQDAVLVNGYRGGDDRPKQINGMNYLPAFVVTELNKIYFDLTTKQPCVEASSVALFPSGTRDCGEQYIYTVYEKDNAIHLTVSGYESDYDGPIADFNPT